MIWKGYVEKWSGEIKINRDIHSYIYKERKENKKKTNLNTHTPPWTPDARCILPAPDALSRSCVRDCTAWEPSEVRVLRGPASMRILFFEGQACESWVSAHLQRVKRERGNYPKNKLLLGALETGTEQIKGNRLTTALRCDGFGNQISIHKFIKQL